MNYLTFRRELGLIPIFSLEDIRVHYPNFDRRRLSEWQTKKYVEKLIRGYYRFVDMPLDDNWLYLIANKLYQPSYISLEMGLRYYGIIPESVYTVTSCSTNKTTTIKTPVATFSYQSLKPGLMFGTHLVPVGKTNFVIGDPEKVILDYFYLHSEDDSVTKIGELRLNAEILREMINWKKLSTYLEIYNLKTLTARIKLLKETVYA